MFAFLKRRWILLSCVLAILACSVVTATLASRITPNYVWYGVIDGNFYCTYWKSLDGVPKEVGTEVSSHSPRFVELHKPMLGSVPSYETIPNLGLFEALIPLWLPLSAILGWIVIRELRWRETARAPALPSDAGGQIARRLRCAPPGSLRLAISFHSVRSSRGIKGDNRAKASDANPPQP